MKHPVSSYHKQTRGLTLTEVGVTLAVVSFIMAGVWVAAASVNQKSRIDNALNQMRTVVQNIRDMYGNTHQFNATNTDITAMMVTAGVFPADMLVAAAPQTKWGTNIVLRTGATVTQVTYEWQAPLPVEVCKMMAGRLGGTGRDEQLAEIRADVTTYNTDALLDTLTPISAPDCAALTVTYNLR